MKKFFASLVTILLALSMPALSQAKEINVLRFNPPGGNVAIWADAAVQTLKEAGWDVTLRGFKSCRDARAWYDKNPKAPIVYMIWTDYAVMDMIDINNPAGCGFETSEKTLVGIVGRWWNFICAKEENASMEKLMNKEPGKIAVWSYPIQLGVAKAQMKAIAPSKTVVGIYSPKTMLQAFSAGDVDYLIMSSENMADGVNCKRFGTSASMKDAQAHMPGRVSYEAFKDVPFIGYGIYPYFAAENTDIKEIRDLFKNHPSELFSKMMIGLIPETKSVHDQVQDLKSIAHGVEPLLEK